MSKCKYLNSSPSPREIVQLGLKWPETSDAIEKNQKPRNRRRKHIAEKSLASRVSQSLVGDAESWMDDTLLQWLAVTTPCKCNIAGRTF